MKRPIHSHTIGLTFVAACLVIAGVVIGTSLSTHRLVRSFDSVSLSHQAIEKLQAIQVLIETEQTSVYNYVITGRAERLDVFWSANSQIPRRISEVEVLVKGHPREMNALRQFRRLYYLHQRYLSTVIKSRRTEGMNSAAQWVSAEDNRSIRDVLKMVLAEVQGEERNLLKKRSASTVINSSRIKLTQASSAFLFFLLIIAVFALLRRESGERYAAQAATLRMEHFLRSIIDRIPYVVQVKEAESLRLTLVNKAATEWFGRSEQELLGSNDYDLRPRDAAKLAMAQDKELIRKGDPVDIPEEFWIHEGKERILHTQKLIIPDETGAPAFLLSISEDITQRKEAEYELEHSRDVAVQSERLKSEFIRNMSHEFRTPLSIVVGMISILLDSNLSAEQRGFTKRAEKATAGLVKLTRNISDFSKIESGTFTLDLQEFNLRQNIDAILSMLKEQAKTKGVKLVSLVPPAIPQTLIGDSIRLRQVLTELVGNALKFTERGEISVRVTEEKQKDDRLWLKLSVSDTGIGILPELQKYLFEPFRQGDGSPTRRFGGTGLGLAISKSIVELMGGTIGYQSAPKEGSTFWCSLPFKKRSVQAPQSVNVPALPWTKARVLVVDENSTARQELRDQLRTWSLASEGTATGETALELLQSEAKAGRPFQIVILNMHLPDMEGVAFAHAVKANPELLSVQLVVVSDAPLEPSTVSELGFSACVPKPLEANILLDRLASLIQLSDHKESAA